MFADPFSNLMLIVLLFFAGLLIMFIFMLRSIEANWRGQEETRRQLALSLGDLERKINELTRLCEIAQGEGGAPEKGLRAFADNELTLPGLSLQPETERPLPALDDEPDNLPDLLSRLAQRSEDNQAGDSEAAAPALSPQADSTPKN